MQKQRCAQTQLRLLLVLWQQPVLCRGNEGAKGQAVHQWNWSRGAKHERSEDVEGVGCILKSHELQIQLLAIFVRPIKPNKTAL